MRYTIEAVETDLSTSLSSLKIHLVAQNKKDRRKLLELHDAGFFKAMTWDALGGPLNGFVYVQNQVQETLRRTKGRR